ncbi:MAG: hypothetical protein M0P47_10460 [Bacteroidales bacterium]|nr:hypothetical protein [Bacteroidales bacterium]
MFRFKFLWVVSAICLSLITGCNCGNKRLQVNVSKIPVAPVTIKRYDLDLFKVRTTLLQHDLEMLKGQYSFFLGTDLSDPSKLAEMKAYLENQRNINFKDQIKSRFSDLKPLENSLTLAFKHYLYYFPQASVPVVYSYISGGDYTYPVQFADNVLLVGLDNYLGKDCKIYKADGLPAYRAGTMTPDFILPDVMKALSFKVFPEQFPGNNLLEQMIESGKRLYFCEAMIPETKAQYIVHYTPSQFNWIVKNEAPVWTAIIENGMLYTSNGKLIRSFMADGPFTSEFSKEAPPRLGEWLGWRIVGKYMENQPEVTLQQLMAEKDFQKILTLSKFKPKK